MKREIVEPILKGVLTLGAALVPFALLYLVAAFMNLSWDFAKWDVAGRAAVGLFGLLFGVMTGGLAGIGLYGSRWDKE